MSLGFVLLVRSLCLFYRPLRLPEHFGEYGMERNSRRSVVLLCGSAVTLRAVKYLDIAACACVAVARYPAVELAGGAGKENMTNNHQAFHALPLIPVTDAKLDGSGA
jgi:hypothetical protein